MPAESLLGQPFQMQSYGHFPYQPPIVSSLLPSRFLVPTTACVKSSLDMLHLHGLEPEFGGHGSLNRMLNAESVYKRLNRGSGTCLLETGAGNETML